MIQVPMTLTLGQAQGQISPKWVKNQRTGHISEAISPTDFILGTKLQSNKVHSMTQVPMSLTFGQKVKVKFPPKWVKNQRTVHISEAISPTDYIISIITAFCDSFGRCPLVLSLY